MIEDVSNAEIPTKLSECAPYIVRCKESIKLLD